MTSNKPYLIRAIYDWIVDNQLTPYIVVNADYPGCDLPLDYVHEGRIILNISPQACRGLHMANDRILFTARFSAQSIQVFIIPNAVLAIYAKENGKGMEFTEDEVPATPPPPPPPLKTDKRPDLKPALRIVKKNSAQEEDNT